MKSLKQVREQAVPVAGAPGATSVSGGGIAGINPGEIPPVAAGITTAKHGKKKYKQFKSFINNSVSGRSILSLGKK